jgi:hypothetical protein
MRLHATRKNLVPSAPDEPSTCALDSYRSLPFIAPLRLRWSPVVFQRKVPSISFPFLPLRRFFLHNDRGTPTPHRFPALSAAFQTSLNSFNSFTLIFLRTLLHCGFSQLLLFQLLPHSFAKTTGGTYPSKANCLSTGTTCRAPTNRTPRCPQRSAAPTKKKDAGLSPQRTRGAPTRRGKARRYKSRRGPR